MGRKARIKEREEKRKERQENNWKKNSYHNMAENGELGHKELEKYLSMYEGLGKEKRNGFKHPDKNPNRNDYNQLKTFYCKSSSSLERRAYY